MFRRALRIFFSFFCGIVKPICKLQHKFSSTCGSDKYYISGLRHCLANIYTLRQVSLPIRQTAAPTPSSPETSGKLNVSLTLFINKARKFNKQVTVTSNQHSFQRYFMAMREIKGKTFVCTYRI